MVTSMGIIGGSGPLGRGLAGRFAQTGLDVTIGSRDAQRAADAAASVVSALDGLATPGQVTGALNADLLDRDLVVITLPSSGLAGTLAPLSDGLAGRIVVSTVNPLGFDDVGPHPVRLPDGSAAATIARLLPASRVTGAFHTVSSHHLLRFGVPMDDDVPVVGDDGEAVDAVVDVVGRVAGLRAVAAGRLRLAAPLEDLTAVLISVNRHYRRHAGIRFTRLPSGHQ